MDRWYIEKLNKIHAFEQDAIKSLEESIKTTIDSFGERFFKLRWLGAKNTPPDPPISINPANQQNKGFGRMEIWVRFRTFFADFCIEFDGFSAIFLWFFIGFQRILYEV